MSELNREYQQLLATYNTEFRPDGAYRCHLVDTMARAAARMRHLDRVEEASLDLLLDPSPENESQYHRLAAHYPNATVASEKLARQRNAADRSYHRAFKALIADQKLQNELAPRRVASPASEQTTPPPVNTPAPDLDLTNSADRQMLYRNLRDGRPPYSVPGVPRNNIDPDQRRNH